MKVSAVVLLGFLSVLASRCDGHAFRMAECPKVKVMEEFDMEKFSGVWFVQKRFQPICTCIKINITKDSGGNYKVAETGRPFGINFRFDPFERKFQQLKFLSNKTESIFRIQSIFGPLGPATFGVVSTDYDRYGVVWGCDPLLLGSMQDVSILTRDPKADEDLIKAAEAKMEGFDVDLGSLKEVDQTRCTTAEPDDEGASSPSRYNNMIIGN